jgi:hypothetical protein
MLERTGILDKFVENTLDYRDEPNTTLNKRNERRSIRQVDGILVDP